MITSSVDQLLTTNAYKMTPDIAYFFTCFARARGPILLLAGLLLLPIARPSRPVRAGDAPSPSTLDGVAPWFPADSETIVGSHPVHFGADPENASGHSGEWYRLASLPLSLACYDEALIIKEVSLSDAELAVFGGRNFAPVGPLGAFAYTGAAIIVNRDIRNTEHAFAELARRAEKVRSVGAARVLTIRHTGGDHSEPTPRRADRIFVAVTRTGAMVVANDDTYLRGVLERSTGPQDDIAACVETRAWRDLDTESFVWSCRVCGKVIRQPQISSVNWCVRIGAQSRFKASYWLSAGNQIERALGSIRRRWSPNNSRMHPSVTFGQDDTVRVTVDPVAETIQSHYAFAIYALLGESGAID